MAIAATTTGTAALVAVYVLAIAAGLLFGIGSVVQQRVAFVAPPGKSLRPSLLLWLVRQPLWLVGVGTAVVGNLFSGAALGLGSVALVQPLLVSRLLFAVPLSAVWARQRLHLRDWLGLLATAGGLATFVVVAAPDPGDRAEPSNLEWLLVAGLIGLITGGLVLVARRLAPTREAPVLGLGAGMLFALQAGLMHTAVRTFIDDGLVAMLLSWTPYAVAIAAIVGTLLAQSAYEMAPLASSYPALAAIEPLAGIGIGVGILGTVLTVGALPTAIYVLALAVMTYGIYLLTTSPLVTGQKDVIELRRLEDRIAETEERLDEDLRALAEEVDRLREPVAGERPPAEADGRVDELLERIRSDLDQLDEMNEACEAPRPEDQVAESPALRALSRYHEDNRRRERRLQERATELATAAANQRRPRGAGPDGA